MGNNNYISVNLRVQDCFFNPETETHPYYKWESGVFYIKIDNGPNANEPTIDVTELETVVRRLVDQNKDVMLTRTELRYDELDSVLDQINRKEKYVHELLKIVYSEFASLLSHRVTMQTGPVWVFATAENSISMSYYNYEGDNVSSDYLDALRD